MRNINELIGIIKGINFDGIINEKEVVRLQSWVDKNRNLAYEVQQVELIKLVDEVLEDSFITDEERDLMLRSSERFLKKTMDNSTRIYELNGIIEGIICDGEVNEQEVYRLKAWMDAYGNCIKGYKSSESLCNIIKAILADGIVTKAEQEQLLQMLSVKISSSQFETKLEYLRKLVKSRNNIGIDLIDILDNKGAMDEIHRLAEAQLKNTLNSYTVSFVSDSEIVFISLVLIAMLKYDGNYYDNVQTTYTTLYRLYPEQKIEGLIRTILNRYRTGEETRTSRSRIINVVLANAIVPSHFLTPFFEFIYDIYKLNFEYALVEDLYGEFKFVYEGLQSHMLSDGDDIQLNVTKKTYKLIRSTKRLIANDRDMESAIRLSMIIVRLIDKKIWNKEIKINNPYLKAGYEGWLATLKADISDKKHGRMLSDIHSRWEPKYLLNNNEIHIVPPIHKVKAEYNYRDIKVVVLNGKKEIYVNAEPDIREIIGGYQISISQINIEEPLGRISYKLMAGKDVIYDSKDKLYRNVIVFDTNGNEIQNNSDYSGTSVFCYKNEHKKLKAFYNCSYYKLASQNVRLGSAYVIEDTIFNFSSLIKPGIFGEEYSNHYLVEVKSEKKILVYKHVKFLVFESENTSLSFEIVLDGKSYGLSKFNYTITEREGVNKYVVDLEINESGIHSICVYQLANGKKVKLWLFDFALDKALEVDELKLDDERYMVSVKTDMCAAVINAEINVSDFSEDLIKIECNQGEYIYCIPFNFEIYRIEGSSWKPMNQALWIGDITQESIFNIYGTEVNKLQVYASTGEPLDEVIKLKSKGVYQQVPIGFIMSYKSSYDYIRLIFLLDGIEKKEILCYNRCILDESETDIIFDSVNKILDVSTSYYGQGQVFFSMYNTLGEQVYKSDIIENGRTERIVGLRSFEKYSICFYEKVKGISLKKDRLMQQYEKVFYAWEDFIGHSFKIREVYFDQFVKGKFLRRNHYFNTTYVRFISKKDEDLYMGDVFVKTGKGKYLLYCINPVSIEICSEVLDETIELSMTKDGDGLFLDFEKHEIKNTLYDDSATDIFSYIIDMNEVE
ncbi:hypothetical protein [Aminipila luticellarii]|uniref:Uncharacterized protein n=1 Tax=Aminipila luticellarii TaxID=2507160 RepID=A0A410PU88_9FIRM|nr:hypothetical protein [Aminipila luticellarii]QAT42436.1 hypothetical protein EQM06_03885 [Aminipila luticellarii]